MASVYLKRDTWYVGFRDGAGRRVCLATAAATKTEARRLGEDLERQAERQRLGLEARPSDSGQTLAELCEWWLSSRCPEASMARARSLFRVHVASHPVGSIRLPGVTSALLEAHLANRTKAGLGPASINRLRGALRTVFSRARQAGLWAGPNPVADTEPRKVPRRLYDTLTAEEAARLLPHVPADWRGFFAAAVFAGLRKGECAGLRKADADLARGTLTVRASYDRGTTKGGHADVIPLPEPLRPYVEDGLRTPGPYLFGAPGGSMRTEESDPQKVLRHALARAELVTGFEHRCRRHHCGFREAHGDAAPRDCPTCGMRLWPVPLPRPLRFHDLRHSCATILLRAGVDVHRVQRILRHASVTTTAGTYAHLAVEDLREGMTAAFGGASEPTPSETARAEAVGAESPDPLPDATRVLPEAPEGALPTAAVAENALQSGGLEGGRSRARTCDPLRVRETLYR